MSRILIAYGTTEGHTRSICEQVRDWLVESGHEVTLVDTKVKPLTPSFEGVECAIIAGSLHQEKHQPSLLRFVKKHRESLNKVPSLMLSVSLTAVLRDDKHLADAKVCVDRFTVDAKWIPKSVHLVAGALKYTEYDWMKRMLMKMISKRHEIEIDTHKDHIYTDWDDLKAVVFSFIGARTRVAV